MGFILFFLIAISASVIGGICGIGGGVLMKPLIDLFDLTDASTASFLSACTVLVMSLYNVGKRFLERSGSIEIKTTLPLAFGAAAGGLLGSRLFSLACRAFTVDAAGFAQALCLMLLTAATLLYTLNKKKVTTRRITSPAVCVIIGLLLGMLSSFLGIGGGPFNIEVLHYFFSMGTKIAVANSLFIILLSQAASLGSTLLSGSAPQVSPFLIMLMVCGGISGGMIGHKLNKKLEAPVIEKLFIGLMTVIIGICIFNAVSRLSAII